MQDKDWYVLFIADESGRVRVSRANHPRVQLSRMQVSNADRLTLLGVVPCAIIEDAVGLEFWFRRKFRKHHVHRSWFTLVDEVRAYILSVSLPPQLGPKPYARKRMPKARLKRWSKFTKKELMAKRKAHLRKYGW